MSTEIFVILRDFDLFKNIYNFIFMQGMFHFFYFFIIQKLIHPVSLLRTLISTVVNQSTKMSCSVAIPPPLPQGVTRPLPPS